VCVLTWGRDGRKALFHKGGKGETRPLEKELTVFRDRRKRRGKERGEGGGGPPPSKTLVPVSFPIAKKVLRVFLSGRGGKKKKRKGERRGK